MGLNKYKLMFRQIKKTTQQYLKQCFALQSLMLFLLFQSMGTYGQSRKELCRICEDRSVIDTAYFDALIGKALVHYQLHTWIECRPIYSRDNIGRLFVQFDGVATYQELDRRGRLLYKVSIYEDRYEEEVPIDEFVICYKKYNSRGRMVQFYKASYLGFRVGRSIEYKATEIDGRRMMFGPYITNHDSNYHVDYLRMIRVSKKHGVDLAVREEGITKTAIRYDYDSQNNQNRRDSVSVWIQSLSKGSSKSYYWLVSIENYQYQWKRYCLLIDAQNGRVLGKKVMNMRENIEKNGHPPKVILSDSILKSVVNKEILRLPYPADQRASASDYGSLIPCKQNVDSFTRFTSFDLRTQFLYDSLKTRRRIIRLSSKDTQDLVVAFDELIIDDWFSVVRLYSEGQIKEAFVKCSLGFEFHRCVKVDDDWLFLDDSCKFNFVQLVQFCDSIGFWPEGNPIKEIRILKYLYNRSTIPSVLYCKKYEGRMCWWVKIRGGRNNRTKIMVVDAGSGELVNVYFVSK